MKIEIPRELGDILREASAKVNAANRTLEVAMNNHSTIMENIQPVVDEVWLKLEADLALDIQNHNWVYRELDGKPYVVTYNPPAKRDADSEA